MEGLYIGATGMLSSQNHINTHANNIANANTGGFKFDTMISKVYEENRANRNETGQKTYIGPYSNKVTEEGIVINLQPGDTKFTDNLLNVAIEDGVNNAVSFFVVSMNNENLLTRNGEFGLNNERQLKTTSGAFVLDVNGEKITIPEHVKPIINGEGNVINSETEEVIAQIQLKEINPENRELLSKEQGAMFRYLGDLANLPISDSELKPGMVELSNVSMSKEMVDLLTSQKRFQASQKAFVAYDKILEKEANQLMR